MNLDFEWIDLKGPFRRITIEQARQFDQQGFFVLEHAFDAALMAKLIEAIDPIEEEVENIVRDKLGGKAFIMRVDEISFTTHLVAKSKVARDFTLHPVFQDLAHDLLGPDVRLYWDQSVYKKPAAKDPFPWHQDNGYTYVEPQRYLTCWVALTDATIENGCPWVLPGVHRNGTVQHEISDLGFVCTEDPAGTLAVPASAGSIIVLSSLTPHATGPNTTDEIRKSYIVQFAPDGASVVSENDGQKVRTLCDAPERQFPILVGGVPPIQGDA